MIFMVLPIFMISHDFLPTEDEVRIENLRPSTNYIFRIRAKNEVGFGNYKEFTHTTVDIRKYNGPDVTIFTHHQAEFVHDHEKAI